MEEFHAGGFTIPESELEERFETSGGPGGQHANRNETAVRLRLAVSGSSIPQDIKSKLIERIGDPIEVVSAESRSQFRNRALARQRLRDKIEAALVDPRTRRPTKPTKSSRTKRLADKRARSRIKRLRGRPGPDD